MQVTRKALAEWKYRHPPAVTLGQSGTILKKAGATGESSVHLLTNSAREAPGTHGVGTQRVGMWRAMITSTHQSNKDLGERRVSWQGRVRSGNVWTNQEKARAQAIPATWPMSIAR